MENFITDKNIKQEEEEEINIEDYNNKNIYNVSEIKDSDSNSNSTNKDSLYGNKNDRIPQDINNDNLLLKNKNYKIEILEEHQKNYDFNFKIKVIGNIGVDKSCLSLIAKKGIFIEEYYTSTVGFEFYCFNVKINNKIVKLHIF